MTTDNEIALTGGVESGETMVMVNVWTALASEPPFAVPPLSWTLTLTVATPVVPAGV